MGKQFSPYPQTPVRHKYHAPLKKGIAPKETHRGDVVSKISALRVCTRSARFYVRCYEQRAWKRSATKYTLAHRVAPEEHAPQDSLLSAKSALSLNIELLEAI